MIPFIDVIKDVLVKRIEHEYICCDTEESVQLTEIL